MCVLYEKQSDKNVPRDKDNIWRFSLSFHQARPRINAVCRVCLTKLGYTHTGNKPSEELRRQTNNKHMRGRPGENRKSNQLSLP